MFLACRLFPRLRTYRRDAAMLGQGQELARVPSSVTVKSGRTIGYLATGNVAEMLPLGCEYIAVAVLGERASIRHQPMSVPHSRQVTRSCARSGTRCDRASASRSGPRCSAGDPQPEARRFV